MSAAKMYTSINVVDRLTKPIHSQASPSDESMRAFDTSFEGNNHTPGSNRLVMDAATFIGSLQTGAASASTPTNSVNPNMNGYVTGGKSVSSVTETKKLDKEDLDRFLQRQKQVLEKRATQTKAVRYLNILN